MPVFSYALALAIVGVVPVIGVDPVIGVAVRIEGKKYVTPITGSIVTGGLRLCGRLVAGFGRRSPDFRLTPITGTLGTCGNFQEFYHTPR